MAKLGYAFHTGSFDVGLHFDAYPPGYDPERNPVMEFWITVIPPTEPQGRVRTGMNRR